MLNIFRIFQDKKGAAYIEIAFLVLISVLLLSLFISLMLFGFKAQKVDNVATEIVQYAAVCGSTGDDVRNKAENLLNNAGLSDVISLNITGNNVAGTQNVQLGDTITVTLKVNFKLGMPNGDGIVNVPITVTKTAISQNYMT